MEREGLMYPVPSLREKLRKIGIPEDKHSFQALLAMLPTPLENINSHSVDTMAEIIIYFRSKGII